MKVNVVCVWWGDKYDESFVRILHAMVGRHLSIPHTFWVYTDHDHEFHDGIKVIPIQIEGSVAHMNKYHLWSSDVMPNNNPTLLFDLDVVVKGSIDHLFDDIRPGMITLAPARWTDWMGGVQANSSVMGWVPGTIDDVFENFGGREFELEMKYLGIDRSLWHEYNDRVALFADGNIYSRMLGIDQERNMIAREGYVNWHIDWPVCIFNGVGLLTDHDYNDLDPYKQYEHHRRLD